MPRQMSQGLAVDLDIGFVQAVDKAAVAHVVQSASGVDTRNPQSAELAFLLFAVSKGEGAGALDGLPGSAIAGASAAKITPGG